MANQKANRTERKTQFSKQVNRYYRSVEEAAWNCGADEKVMKLGTFPSGTFGVYGKRIRDLMVTIYMVCKK